MAAGMTIGAIVGNASVRRLKTLAPFLAFAALAALPLAGAGTDLVRLLFITLTWTAASLAWNLLGGLAGQVSFGFAVFYGLGAYTAMLMMNAGVPPAIAFCGSAAVAALASFLVGLPTFRLRGPYFAIATIGVTEAVRVVMNNLAITGGASGLRSTEHRPFRQLEHYYAALVLAAVAVAVSVAISRSRFGLALRAIRQDEDAAADAGVNPYACKLWVHAVAAALTGASGGVFAGYAGYIHPEGVFAFNTGVSILLMPVIGGIGTVGGAVLGGMIFGVVEEELVANFPQIHLLLYGSLLILIILFEPDGLMGLLHRLFRRFRDHASRSEGTDEVLWRAGRPEGREL